MMLSEANNQHQRIEHDSNEDVVYLKTIMFCMNEKLNELLMKTNSEALGILNIPNLMKNLKIIKFFWKIQVFWITLMFFSEKEWEERKQSEFDRDNSDNDEEQELHHPEGAAERVSKLFNK